MRLSQHRQRRHIVVAGVHHGHHQEHSRWTLVVATLIGLLGGTGSGCTPQGDPALSQHGFRDGFDRTELGEAWFNTGGPYRIHGGRLQVQGARNRPLWLRRTLPAEVRVEFDARSESRDGDIKFELFGDGSSKATSDSYVASGYVMVLGGWHNTLNIIARRDEHGADRAVGAPLRVQPNRTYRIACERRKNHLKFWVDDTLVVEMTDPNPLQGRGQDHFAVNNWESQVSFDNLVIQPL